MTDLKLGEERDVYWVTKWVGNSRGLQVQPWAVTAIKVSFSRGQVLDVAVGHRDYVKNWEGSGYKNITIDRVQNASIYRDVEFSYRVAGEVKLEMMEEGRARIAVREGEPLTQYEIFATSTGGTCEYAPLEFKVKRIF